MRYFFILGGKAMREFHISLLIMVAVIVGMISVSHAMSHDDEDIDKQLIASAMSAAPQDVGSNATVVAMEADGTIRAVREGTNGFTCMPDNPATPGPDPMCMDKNALEWAMAWISKTEPPAGEVGFMYMLAGGTDASNTDPYATEPTSGNHWIQTGPHVMIVGAADSFYDLYPHRADPDTSQPYTMWADTPYVHLMAPVQ
jgi:hypothetical protein